jgi:RimJ/RimL family protein N-acetyltransferase
MTRRPKTPPKWLPLTTERLILRDLRASDVDDIHAYAADRRVTRFMDWGPNTPEETKVFLDRHLEEQKTWPRSGVNMAIEVAAEARLIGAIRLGIVDAKTRTGDFGYSLNADYWNRGYATEAAAALLRVGFETLGLRRIFATCDVRNTGSWTVMEKLGMRREATFRQDVRARTGWRDTYLYAILATEWRRQARASGGRAGRP